MMTSTSRSNVARFISVDFDVAACEVRPVLQVIYIVCRR
jgi:hypothetical protein